MQNRVETQIKNPYKNPKSTPVLQGADPPTNADAATGPVTCLKTGTMPENQHHAGKPARNQ